MYLGTCRGIRGNCLDVGHHVKQKPQTIRRSADVIIRDASWITTELKMEQKSVTEIRSVVKIHHVI